MDGTGRLNINKFYIRCHFLIYFDPVYSQNVQIISFDFISQRFGSFLNARARLFSESLINLWPAMQGLNGA